MPSRREALARRPVQAAGPVAPTPLEAPAGQPPAPVLQPATKVAAAPPAPARKSPRASRPPRPARASGAWPKADILAGAGLAIVAAIAAATLPTGPLRLLLTLPMMLLVPGYLLLQAFVVPAATGPRRGWQALASLGISPAVLGLLAMLTTVVEGGFRLDAILAVTTLGCLVMASTAMVRRRNLARAPVAAAAHAPQAATAKSGSPRP